MNASETLLAPIRGFISYFTDHGHLRSMPIIEARRTKLGLAISCPYCGGVHYHPGREGTRVAACSEAEGREYYLRPSDSTGDYLCWGCSSWSEMTPDNWRILVTY
jgi:hypothetical protein